MTDPDPRTCSDGELVAEFDRLFPSGFAGPDVLQELAPDGWENSPPLAVFHPTLEQLHEEACRVHRNLAELRRADHPHPLPPEPTLAELARDYRETTVETAQEVAELVGHCL